VDAKAFPLVDFFIVVFWVGAFLVVGIWDEYFMTVVVLAAGNFTVLDFLVGITLMEVLAAVVFLRAFPKVKRIRVSRATLNTLFII